MSAVNAAAPGPNLVSAFVEACANDPGRPALFVDEHEYDYAGLATEARRIQVRLERELSEEARFVGILATRSISSFAGTLAALLAGRTYVPMHPRFPALRLARVAARSRPGAIVVGHEALETLEQLAAACDAPQCFVLPDGCDRASWQGRFPEHTFVSPASPEELPDGIDVRPPARLAYLLFTSGSTGEPKGVGVTHANAATYVTTMQRRLGYEPDDRFSFNFDLTFDLSVHDLFCAWGAGASIWCPPEKVVMAPARHTRDRELTCWFSVPVTASRMRELRMLRAGVFPRLRISLFCGEPLPVEVAEAWQAAAPASLVENLYGPTEATIAITAHRFGPETAAASHAGIVPIGRPIGCERVQVTSPEGSPVAPGEPGELWLAGDQVTPGYFEDPERTAEQFVRSKEEPGVVWYRTGDRVYEGADGDLRFLSRLDHQVKIRGYRVELAEIEGVLRDASGVSNVVALAWPPGVEGADHVEAFLETDGSLDEERILERCRMELPSYMVPRSLHPQPKLPTNSNGKLDRPELARRLSERRTPPSPAAASKAQAAR